MPLIITKLGLIWILRFESALGLYFQTWEEKVDYFVKLYFIANGMLLVPQQLVISHNEHDVYVERPWKRQFCVSQDISLANA